MQFPQATTLTAEELAEVINRVAPSGIEYGAARICRVLAQEHSVQTVRINTRCSVGNISDLVSKCVNPRIKDMGLYVACVKPAYAIKNKFDQPSGQMLWSFYRDIAANDPDYQQEPLQDALRRDLSALRDEYPDQHIPSLFETADGWQEVLEGSDHASR